MIIIEYSGTRLTTRLAKTLEIILENKYNFQTVHQITPDIQGCQLYHDLDFEKNGNETYIGRFAEMPSEETLDFHLRLAGLI